MRIASALTLLLTLAAVPSLAAETARLELTDEKLPLQEIRPLDRHVYILTLEGKWNQPADSSDTPYYVNILFPNGGSYSHRVLDDRLFRRGEVRCVLQEYQMLRNQFCRGDKLTIVISAKRSVKSASAPEVISAPLEVEWPLDRKQVSRPVKTRFSDPEPVDAFPPPDQPPPVKKPEPKEKEKPEPD
jgi:hypothetical protein